MIASKSSTLCGAQSIQISDQDLGAKYFLEEYEKDGNHYGFSYARFNSPSLRSCPKIEVPPVRFPVPLAPSGNDLEITPRQHLFKEFEKDGNHYGFSDARFNSPSLRITEH